MDSSPGGSNPQLPSVAGVKRAAPGPLLPAFEFSSSPSLPRPAKRFAREPGKSQEDNGAKYPTPVPTSSTGIISSSPPQVSTSRPALQRTQSTLSERAPLSAVPSVTLSEDGEPLLMGRSSNSSHYQLSANRFISRIHVKATYIRATNPLASNKIELVCMGWNGVKIHCQGRATELGKGDTFTSETENADLMLDVQDARVLIGWPARDRSGTSVHSDSAWEEDGSPRRGHASAQSPVGVSPLRRIQRLQSPVSPTPGGGALVPALGSQGNGLPVIVFEDAPSPENDHAATDTAATQSTQFLSQLSHGEPLHFSQPEEEAKNAEEFSDQDEENDPVIQAFGPQGDNLLPRMALVMAGASPKTAPHSGRSNVSASPQRRSGSASTNDADMSPLANHIVNQLAFSRLSSTPVSTIMNHLPVELKGDSAASPENKSLSISELKNVLDSTDCIGKVSREGKDAAGKALESEYYYIPDLDVDEGRRATVVDGLQKPGLRACRKQHKQYYWRELRDLNASVWEGEKGASYSPQSSAARKLTRTLDVFRVNPSLDSSLKKNTAFIKRLRTSITTSALPGFVQDIKALSLHKYLSEIISACYEGLCKLKSPGEVAAGVEVVSALHQRFGPPEFTGYLAWYVGRGLTTPEKSHLKTLTQEAREKEEKERLARQRVLLKVVTELWLVGVLRSLEDAARPEDAAGSKDSTATSGGRHADGGQKSKSALNGSKSETSPEAEPFPLEVLKDVLGHDREHVNLSLVVLFVKSFSLDVLGIKPAITGEQKAVGEDGVTSGASDEDYHSGTEESSTETIAVDMSSLISTELQQRFRNVLGRYFQDVKEHVARDQKTLASQARRNAEAYVKSGEIFEDRQANYEKQTKSHEKLVANAQVLADTLGLEMPEMKGAEDASAAQNAEIGLVKTGEYLRDQAEGPGIWEDDEERRFYENLIDLKDRVPGILLEDGKKKRPEEEQVGKKIESKDGANSVGPTPKEPAKDQSGDAPIPDADEQSTTIINKSIGAQVDLLLARLPEFTNKDLVDEAAIDFCFLNSKASRNRLIKALQEIPKGRVDLLPLYARLTATLGRYMPDIAQGLVTYLDSEFRSLQRRKDKDFLGQVRTINIRYLAELTKFAIVPEHVLFHCLKVSLDEFSRMNIEIMCNLLENCGRFLLRNPETAPRMASFLETLQRKKSAHHLGQQERMLIDNAMYYVNPPERAAIQQKERTPMELFIRKLIYLDMNKRNYTRILKQIRKLHWEEEEVTAILSKIFSKPGKVKHSSIHLLAILCGALYRYHQDFVVSVIDDILEQITVGLENNDFRFNQRRVAEVKYLGELYNYKMVDSPVIFDSLYRIVTFGHEGGTPKPGRFCPLDMPDDYFRVRLVCTILETCGMCFDRGAAKTKLDFFLSFFQYYIFTKESIPMDVDFLVHDTYALARPQWKLAVDLDEASQVFSEAVSKNYKPQEAEKDAESDGSDDDLSSLDGVDEDEIAVPEGEDGQVSSDEAEVGGNEDLSSEKSDSEDEEDIVVTRQEEERDPEVDAEFDRELAKMMTDSLDSRKTERKAMFDVPLPMRRNNRDSAALADGTQSDNLPPPSETMAFSMLTKKGNRQTTRTLELPSNSHFAVAMKTQKQAEREEQQRIKNLVLNYDLRDEEVDGETHRPKVQSNTNTERTQGLEKRVVSSNRPERGGGGRRQPQARRLQLSDVDW
ncbi:MAG: hypothetical protein M4579_000677 [Chaenotheca gracillima]|nr:MAG: hypothetical protein M4579_000677 [Chaenotheca gracillima]